MMKLNSVKAVFVLLLSALPASAQVPTAPKPIDLLRQSWNRFLLA
jgi:hypothetical protein